MKFRKIKAFAVRQKGIVGILCLVIVGLFMAASCDKSEPPPEESNIFASVDKVDATIVKGCFEYRETIKDTFSTTFKDTFSIILDGSPDTLPLVYPSTPIPANLRVDGLRVVVSGDILKPATYNECYVDSHVKLHPERKFVITQINKKL